MKTSIEEGRPILTSGFRGVQSMVPWHDGFGRHHGTRQEKKDAYLFTKTDFLINAFIRATEELAFCGLLHF